MKSIIYQNIIMTKILVTSGAEFIGFHLCEKLIDAGTTTPKTA